MLIGVAGESVWCVLAGVAGEGVWCVLQERGLVVCVGRCCKKEGCHVCWQVLHKRDAWCVMAGV